MRIRTTLRTTHWITALVTVLLLLLAACGGGGDGAAGGDGGTDAGGESEAAGGEGGEGSIAQDFDLSGQSFTVGSKEFTENQILGQITLQALQAAGADVSDQTGLTGTATVREALESGDVDMYWDYTGTGWVQLLGNEPSGFPEDLYSAVAEADLEENSVKWLEPAPFEDTYRLAVPSAFAEENDLATMSDVTAFAEENPDQLTLCAASEFINREDGLIGLEETYDVEFEVSELDLGLVFTQLGSSCNFGEVFSTDGRIVANDLVVLEDDEKFFIPFNGALTMRQEVFDENPQLADLFAPVSEALDDETVTQMNASVDVDGESQEDVARQFLVEQGFIAE